MSLTRDDLIEIAERYHREDWDGFEPTMAVFDIGRLMGHISVQAERIAALIAAGDRLAVVVECAWGTDDDTVVEWERAKTGGQDA